MNSTGCGTTEEVYNKEILSGSPPCSASRAALSPPHVAYRFSLPGVRESCQERSCRGLEGKSQCLVVGQRMTAETGAFGVFASRGVSAASRLLQLSSAYEGFGI
jgi:hypothetical protein